MAASTKLILLRRPKSHPFINHRSRPHRCFSSSSTPDPLTSTSTDPDPESKSESQSQSQSQSHSTFSSYLKDVKASLQKEPPIQNSPRLSRNTLSFSDSGRQTPPSNAVSLEEIRKNLSEFRRRSVVPPSAGTGQPISFQELYKRNVLPKTDGSGSASPDSAGSAAVGGALSFEAIRESLRKLQSSSGNRQTGSDGSTVDSMSLSRFKESLKMKPGDSNPQESPLMIGGADSLPSSIFGKEEKESGESKNNAMKWEFVRKYNYNELGEKLKALRPEKRKGSWFSLQELNERLIKLRENEEKESEAMAGDTTFNALRRSLMKLQISDNDKAKKNAMQRLEGWSGIPSFMKSPPKDHLVEKYFHPDNMSSAEKLELELKKVRDEFKMSESDCGSARVQVAQLTVKINHLQNLLHKKDKHSRRGLEAMVVRRRKLMNYLRRTDWDSYCLLLSKLGIRFTHEPKLLKYLVRRHPSKKDQSKKKGSKKKAPRKVHV